MIQSEGREVGAEDVVLPSIHTRIVKKVRCVLKGTIVGPDWQMFVEAKSSFELPAQSENDFELKLFILMKSEERESM